MTNRTANARPHLSANHATTKTPTELVTATTARAPLHDRLLPLKSVIEFAGLGKTMIYRLMRQGAFPAAYKPGGHASRWSERELIEWQAAMAAKRYQPQSPLRP